MTTKNELEKRKATASSQINFALVFEIKETQWTYLWKVWDCATYSSHRKAYLVTGVRARQKKCNIANI